MIAREWRAAAAAAKVAEYVTHFEQAVYPDLQQIAGFRGAYVMQQAQADGVEIRVLTLWDSFDAIRSFAGANVERAVVEPAAQAVLRSFDSTVSHYEILVAH